MIVWQKAMELRRQVYAIVRCLPSDERYALGLQLRRAAVSVPSNIAEGQSRQIRRDFRQYLCMARGSIGEIDTQLEIALELCPTSKEQVVQAMRLADEISRMLTALIRRLTG